MIAANYRKHPEAMALQLVLPFSRLFRWHSGRPTTRLGRLFRALAAAAFKAKGYTQPIKKKGVPVWFSAARVRARRLARSVKAACIEIDFQADNEGPVPVAPWPGPEWTTYVQQLKRQQDQAKPR